MASYLETDFKIIEKSVERAKDKQSNRVNKDEKPS